MSNLTKTSTSFGTVARYPGEDQITIARLRVRKEELLGRIDEERQRYYTVNTISAFVLLASFILVVVDQVQTGGGGSAVSFIALITFCQVCAIQSVCAFIKKRYTMAIGFLILDVVAIICFLLVIAMLLRAR